MASSFRKPNKGCATAMRKWVLFLVVSSTALIMVGCSEKAKNPVGFGLVEEDHWQVSRVFTQDVLADSCIDVCTGAGKGYHLLVGFWQGQEARSLLLFSDSLQAEIQLPDTLLPLIGAKLTLMANVDANALAGTDSLNVTVHEIRSAWDDSTVTWETPWSEPGGDFDPEPIAVGILADNASDTLQLDFNTTGLELLAEWLQGQSNNGLILKTIDPQSDNLKYLYTAPKLELTFATSDTSDTTLSAEPDQDAFIVQPGAPIAEDFLCVSDGTVRRSWILFDLPTVPESVFVNRAVLSLSVSEFDSPLEQMTIRAYQVNDIETLAFNTSNYGSASLFSGKDLLEFQITGLVQNWIYGMPNAGLIIKVAGEYQDISSALFFTSAADSLFRPTLTITYTCPPTSKPTGQDRRRQKP